MNESSMTAIDRLLVRWSTIPSSIAVLPGYDDTLIEDGWTALQPITGFKLRALHCRGIHLHRIMGLGGNAALIELAHVARMTYRRPERPGSIDGGKEGAGSTYPMPQRRTTGCGEDMAASLDTPSIGGVRQATMLSRFPLIPPKSQSNLMTKPKRP